jgi:hypothetical protein
MVVRHDNHERGRYGFSIGALAIGAQGTDGEAWPEEKQRKQHPLVFFSH